MPSGRRPTTLTTICPVCASPDFEIVQLSQPRGFRTWYGASWDFDGIFEWTPRASYPKTDPGDPQMQTLANCQFWSGEAEVCIVNNNAGRQFHFLKLANSETWVTQEAMDHVADQIAQRNLRPVSAPVYDQNEPPDIRSLGSVKKTDMLILNLHSIRTGIDLSPMRVEGRAALNSFGFMLRRAMSALLDISPWEIRVGLRVTLHDGRIVGQVFLSDSLENGAGYCSHFNQPAELEKLLRLVASPDDTFLRDWLAPHHSADCQTSCPDCLRDYANLAWHCILDWRLAVDMARLALDANAPLDFSSPYWQPLATSIIPPFFHALGWTPITLGGLLAARSPLRPEALLAVHPLWAADHPSVVQAQDEAHTHGITQPLERKTLFEIIRRPF